MVVGWLRSFMWVDRGASDVCAQPGVAVLLKRKSSGIKPLLQNVGRW
jgi:hypothetical protein